jgi:hypothetical protein
MIAALEAEQSEDTHARQEAIQSTRAKIAGLQAKLDRLMEAYLDQTLSLEEYRDSKNRLVGQKQELKDQLSAAEAGRLNWFEPAIRFVKEAENNGFIAKRAGDEASKLTQLKKVGSNLRITDRHLSVVPRGAWQLVADHGPFAQRTTAPTHAGAVSHGETSHVLQLAEEVRFELTRPLRAYRFSRPAHSAALPLLRRCPDLIPLRGDGQFSGGFAASAAAPTTDWSSARQASSSSWLIVCAMPG